MSARQSTERCGMTLGEKIRMARTDAGLTQAQLADMLSVSRQAVTKWESDKGIPDIENLKAMALLLNVSIDYLMDDGTSLDMAVTREQVDLTKYEGKGRWDKKGEIIRERFPEAEIHSLVSEQDLSKGEKIMDLVLFFFTDAPPRTASIARDFDNLDKHFYLVDQADRQYLVMIADDYMEIRQLPEGIAPDRRGRFKVGDWKFIDYGTLVK